MVTKIKEIFFLLSFNNKCIKISLFIQMERNKVYFPGNDTYIVKIY